MKTTKIISALLVPALFAACSDDMLDSNNVGNVPAENLVEGLTINVGLDKGGDATTRGTFAGSSTKGIFDNFYFEPDFTGESSALVPTSNSAIKGDQVGICLPSPVAGQGTVLTNVPFYIAGYQATPDANGDANLPFSLVPSSNFYKIAESQQTNGAFEASAITTTKEKFVAAVGVLKAGTPALEANVTDISKAIFKSVSGVMTGNYVLYYPYDKDFTDMTKIPAKPLNSIQKQTTLAAGTNGTNDHVLKDNLFAYSKAPFKVDGKKNAAQNMSMTPAAYFFQFKLYTTGSAITLANSGEIKLITVSTKDDAKAFAIKGSVSAGTTNSFVPDAETAVDMIGVETGGNVKVIPAATAENKNTNALTAYLSTYAIPANLTGKDIIVRVYTTTGKVAEFTKAAAGSNIKEGGTDYWNLDFNGVEFKDAEQLVYNESTLTTALAAGGTLVLKNNIDATSALTIGKEVTINGEGYTLTAGNGLTINKAAALNCNVTVPSTKTLTINAASTISKVINNGTVTLKAGASEAKDGVEVTITTLENSGLVTVNAYDKLNATTIENKAVKTTAASLTVMANGALAATTVNNAALVEEDENGDELEAGTISIAGTVANTTINNDGTLTSTAAELPATLKVNNDGDFNINETCNLLATLVNNGKIAIYSGKTVNARGAITNKGEIVNNGVFTLLGDCTLANSGTISDLGTFSGLSRLTNAAGAKVIRTVQGVENFLPAINEPKITDIRIKTAIESKTAITTAKTIYLSESLTLPVDADKKSSLGKVIFEVANKTLIGNLSATGIDVEENGTIGANSNVTVDGDINVAKGKTLTGNAKSYTICNDITGTGTVSGPIYVK